MSDQQHVTLVRAYFQAAGNWTEAQEENRSRGIDSDPLYAVWATTGPNIDTEVPK
jgi:hypothetical protein